MKDAQQIANRIAEIVNKRDLRRALRESGRMLP